MPICAYCNIDKPATREHIIPKFIHEFINKLGDERGCGWNLRAKKILEAETKIKDVCANCNNSILGDLDANAQKTLTDAGVLCEHFINEELILRYDYNKLSRWLLKVSFNSARVTSNAPEVFEPHIDYILGNVTNAPSVIIIAGLLHNIKLSESECEKFKSDINPTPEGIINPFFIRITYTPIPSGSYSFRSIFIGALVFHLVIFHEGVPRTERKETIKELLKTHKGGSILNKNAQKIHIGQFYYSHLEAYRAQMGIPSYANEVLKYSQQRGFL